MDAFTLYWEFPGELLHWRGPAPYHFVAVPDDVAGQLHEMSSALSYGWGVIPVTVRIGDTSFATSLFPKDGGYLVPIKDKVRKAEGLTLGDGMLLEMSIRSGH
jgi:hypothetical protein